MSKKKVQIFELKILIILCRGYEPIRDQEPLFYAVLLPRATLGLCPYVRWGGGGGCAGCWRYSGPVHASRWKPAKASHGFATPDLVALSGTETVGVKINAWHNHRKGNL